jgi:hypothetical protein
MGQKMKSAQNGQIGGENNFGRVWASCIFCIFGQLWRLMAPEPFEREGSNFTGID